MRDSKFTLVFIHRKMKFLPTYVSVVRLRPVGASGPPRVIQTLLVFAALRNRPGLLRHRAATSRFGSSALPTSVVLLLGSPPVRFPTLRLGYSDREPSRGQRAISRLRQIDHHPAPAHWRVLVRHPAKTRRNLVSNRRDVKYKRVCSFLFFRIKSINKRAVLLHAWLVIFKARV